MIGGAGTVTSKHGIAFYKGNTPQCRPLGSFNKGDVFVFSGAVGMVVDVSHLSVDLDKRTVAFIYLATGEVTLGEASILVWPATDVMLKYNIGGEVAA